MSAEAEPRAERAPLRLRPALAWILVVAAAIGVRLIRLEHFSYWLDEILETYTIRENWPGLWRSLHWQALQAPLDYVLRKLIEAVSPSDAIRRLPGVAWGAGCVVAFGALLARRGGRSVGFSAALLLVLAQYHVRYSQEVRPYALGLFLLCLSLLSLDSFLARPRRARLILLYLSTLATMYTLYLGALILAVAAATLLVEDAFGDPVRRLRARRFLAWSPAFLVALAVGYLPWFPVLLRAIGLPAATSAPSWSPRRVERFVSYFGFGPRDAYPLGYRDLVFAILLLGGIVISCQEVRLRFLVVWAIGGVAMLELLEHRHPSYDSIFHWLPAGLGLTALAGVAIGRVLESRISLPAKLAIAILVLGVSLHSLSIYFREGRPDWRPLARFLARTPSSERIFVENQYTQLCLGYYVVGPEWLCCKRPGQREIVNLDGELPRLIAAWDGSQDAWLVLAAGPRSEALRSWARGLPSMTFPTAEGDRSALVCRLRRAVR